MVELVYIEINSDYYEINWFQSRNELRCLALVQIEVSAETSNIMIHIHDRSSFTSYLMSAYFPCSKYSNASLRQNTDCQQLQRTLKAG